MTETVEKDQEAEAPTTDVRHAYCMVCVNYVLAPAKVPAYCGGGQGMDVETAAQAGKWTELQEHRRCVVCDELVKRPCPRCGF